jgi:glycosyltransferase involved in cell wall biosynthesis
MGDIDGLKVCWIGGTRYGQPLNPTLAAKWQALAALNAELFVIGFAHGLRPRRFTQGARFYLLPELPTSVLRYVELFCLAPLLLLWLIYRRGVSVIIAQSPYEGAAAALAKQLARWLGRRVGLAVESHGDFEVAVFTQRRVRFSALYRWLMERFACYAFRHADVLRAVSDSTRAQLQAWAGDKPVVQFMAWIDLDAFGAVERSLPLSQSGGLVYAGVLIPRKGVHTLLDAFAQVADEFPQAVVWLVGKPENAAYTAGLRRQVEELGLQDRVIFVGALPQRELAGYMARARALVLVSSSEGLPRVVIEAMSGGLIVIGSRVSGIPEVVEDGVTGYLVPPGDVDALVAALRALYRNPAIDAMGERARAFARQFFSTEAYVDGYRRLIAAARPAPLSAVEERKTSAG